jgi:hypothetical protein
MSEACVIRQGIFERWFIFHPESVVDGARAWSGSKWVKCGHDGVPYLVQVCNFTTEKEAREYCAENGLDPQ